MSARSTSTCRDCGEPIRWAIGQDGKKVALDANPDPDGRLVASIHQGPKGEELHVQPFMPGLELLRDGTRRNRWSSHFRTCPQADAHRRGR